MLSKQFENGNIMECLRSGDSSVHSFRGFMIDGEKDRKPCIERVVCETMALGPCLFLWEAVGQKDLGFTKDWGR